MKTLSLFSSTLGDVNIPIYPVGTSPGNLRARPIESFGSAVNGYWDAAFSAAVAYAGTVGGLKILLQGQQTYTLAGTFPTIPNNGATAPQAVPIIIEGAGSFWSGRGMPLSGSTILDIQGSATYGKIALNALGLFSLRDLTLTDSKQSGGALIYSTNATLDISGVCFAGITSAGPSTDSAQDAIVLGGQNQVEGGSGWTDGFQGYGTVISKNFFHNIRICVNAQAFANNVIVQNNTVWKTCGYAAGAPFKLNCGSGGQHDVGNLFLGNLIEIAYYKWGYYLANASANVIIGGGFYDETSTTTACFGLDSTAANNNIICGFRSSTLLPYSGSDPGVNQFIDTTNSGSESYYPLPIRMVAPKIADGSVLQFASPSGGSSAEFQADGNNWVSTLNGTGQSMVWNTGTGGSYADIYAYAVRLFSQSGTLVGQLTSNTGTGWVVQVPMTWKPNVSQTLTDNGDLSFIATDNSTVKVLFRGNDGVTRSATLALS